MAAGLTRAPRAVAVCAADHHIVIERDRELRYDPARGISALAVRTDRDRSDDGANSWFYEDGVSGRLIGVNLPTGGHAGNTADYWLGSLHEAGVLGLPFRILMSACGLGIVFVTVTGVLIYWRKRIAALARRRKRPDRALSADGERRTGTA